MSEEKKTNELKEEELEKVSGGAQALDCANCGYFSAKNPDGGRNINNCLYAKPSIGGCKKILIDDDVILQY